MDEQRKSINWTTVLIVFAVVLGGLGYLYVQTLTEKNVIEDKRLDQQKQIADDKLSAEEARESRRETDLLTCVRESEDRASFFWDRECEGLGKEESCRLPSFNASRVDDYKKELKDECFKTYK